MDRIDPSDIFNSPYYNINKNLLKAIGLWPYLSSTRKNVSLAIYSFVCFSLLIPITAGFRNVLTDMVKLIENCIGFIYLLAVYSKYLSAYIFEKRIKLVYEQTIVDWEATTDEKERKILHRYSREGRFLTLFYVGYSIIGVVVFNLLPYIPLALDKYFPLPLNESREHPHPYHPDYFFFDSDKYFFQTFTCHGMYVVLCSTAAPAAIDSMVVANIKHSCGLFAIVCYRLENIAEPVDFDLKTYPLSEQKVHERIEKVCHLHKSAMESVVRIQDSFNISFLIVMGGGLIAIGMLMFDFLMREGDPIPTVVIIIMLFGINICLFYLNWIVQHLIDNSEKVFRSAYNSNWYCLPIKAQKHILIIMQRSMKPCSLTAGSIVDLNLEMYATVVKTSMSYATVMLSMQND